MKSFFTALTLVLAVLSFDAQSYTRETGGMPQPPRAVVIQIIKNADGSIDEAGREIFGNIFTFHMIAERIGFVTLGEDSEKFYYCLEYRGNYDYELARGEFELYLKGHDSIRILQAGMCNR